MKKISLTQGKFALVDDADFDWLNQWRWCFDSGYARRSYQLKGKNMHILMHRLIFNTPKGMETDHINRNKLDNRRCNLRVCTSSQNQWNKGIPVNTSSGLKNVRYDKEPTRRKKWRVSFMRYGKIVNIGRFLTKEEAYQALRREELPNVF